MRKRAEAHVHSVSICIYLMKQQPERVAARFAKMHVPFGSDAAASFGALQAPTGRRRDALDRLIAAHAISLGATLMTNSEADFRGLPGLVVENRVRE